MIRYSLECAEGHKFESWFANSGAFESLRNAQTIACPQCGSKSVDRSLMTPQVSTARQKSTMRLAANQALRAETKEAIRKLRDKVVADSDYVGDKFAEEARKIHYEEVEKRGIYGEATQEEAKALTEEGIEFHPIPMLPEEHN